MKRIGILGRTNVGKSTLFNRLIKQNKSLVSDIAGTTRDFVEGEIMVGGSSIQLVDFGGFDFDTQEIIEKSVQKNISESIQDLDLIIFVVDGRCALGNEDKVIAELIRKSNKPTILVVNKVDGKKQEDEIYDYYSLGFEDVVPVSAVNGINLDDLVLRVSGKLKLRKSKNRTILKKDLTRITIIGKPNVGKSSLFNIFYGGDRSIVTDIAGTTRDTIDAEIKLGDKKYMFVDTAGLRRKTKIADGLDKDSSYRSIKAINNSDVIIYMVDVNNYATSYDIKLLGYAWRKGKSIIVAVNKWDIKPRDMTEGKYKNILIADNSLFKNFPFVFISAAKEWGIEELTEELQRIEKKTPFEIKTSLLNKELQKIIAEIAGVNQKFYYATQTKTKPIEILIFVNKNKFFTKKYTDFIEKKLREKFDLSGIPIFIKLREKESRY